jgi:hypothetical protein
MAEGEPGKYSILELAKVLRDERGSSRKQYWRIVDIPFIHKTPR